jgi:hypothetical protein
MKTMKSNLTIVLTLSLLMSVQSIISQEITIPEPEFINNAVYVEDNQPRRLEKAIPFEVSRRTIASYATGYYADENLKQVKGTASNVRLPIRDSYSFIIRVSSNMFDPYEEIAIIKLEPTRKNRKYKAGGMDMLGQQKSGDLDYVSFQGKKYGESSYLIVVDHQMEPGEYALMLRRASDVLNCFSVVK